MKTVFVDVDTQLDFLYPSGALYVPGAETIVANIARLNRYAAEHGIAVLSDTDAHTENDPEFRTWPPHCIAGTLGQHKPESTLLDRRVTVTSKPGDFAVAGAQQVILEKQTLDCFGNPNLPSVLEQLGADRYLVYGVVTEICVAHAAFGLINTGKPVALVTDAVRHLDLAAQRAMLEQFTAAGGTLTTTDEVLDS